MFQTIKSIWMVCATPATVNITVVMAGMAAVGVLALGWIVNDAHHNILRWKTLEHQSLHDALTGLPNLRFFHERVRDLKYRDLPLAIVMMDVDHFKNYNDTHGHPAGDEVLRTIGCVMQETARPEDIIACYGGEEFILCFVGVHNADEAYELANALQKRIEIHDFYGGEHQPGGRLTVSLGVGISEPIKPLDELIERADRALYTSKRAGRNQVTAAKSGADLEAGDNYPVTH